MKCATVIGLHGSCTESCTPANPLPRLAFFESFGGFVQVCKSFDKKQIKKGGYRPIRNDEKSAKSCTVARLPEMTSKKRDSTRESGVCKEVCNSCATLARGQREERQRKAGPRLSIT